ncbi:hypothetical protein Bca52824_063277 [Brassica carinata]|uniref:Uncharacterized protein n=1 Tax=Brassica carinata TaxID=52824 RepID=A0A8X7QG45_BRACI|nr:hypothetical protein Bca52824_063277 [Brassica carinata]
MQLYVSTAHFLTWVSFLVQLTTVASKPLLFCQRQHQQVANPRRHVDFLRAMSSVNDHITKHKLYVESSFTDVSPPIYVFLQCRQDLSVSHCRRCFNDSKLKLEETCSSSNSGRVHGDNCFLRFDNRDFSEEFVDPRFDRTKCKRTGPVVDKFWIDLDEAFVNATLRAVKKGGFGAASVSPAGGSPGLDGNSCRDCLVNARSSLRACESSEARAFFTGCYLKYSTRKFFDDAAVLKLDDDEGSFRNSSYLPDLSDQDVMKLAVAAFSLSILTSLGAFISYKRFSRERKVFPTSVKLGQGGAGSVYKGILPDGRVVAVKKLFFNTREWADQFFNEVNLISGVQHKNLVRLLGCSIEGPKSLLVYEYVQNRSLDQILFMKNTVHILSWKQRFNIIIGISEGLEYLHRGSEVKIIHRDIKTSNILLDQNLSPKIADFGLARSLGTDKTQTNTGIAGTLGYLAPEYLIKGQLTEKADVYAYGVLIIEIATGKKNNAFSQGTSSALHSLGRSTVKGMFTEEEALKVLEIGLLCVQSSVELRPSMSEIVYMLKNNDCKFDSPRQPPFLSASVLMADEETRD